MAKSTFGEHLKREREMRGVSLDEISAATRIGTRFLEALENEQWERLPGGVFNRGFVRAVARFLGLDEENLVAEYTMATNDQPEVAVWAGDSSAPGAARRLLPWLLGLLLVAVLASGWFAWRRLGFRYPTKGISSGTTPGAAPTSAAPSGPPAPVPNAPPPATESSGAATSSSSAPKAEQPSPATFPAGSASAEPTTLELTVAAGKATDLKVVADGKSVFDGKMSAGQNQHFQAQERFEISAGNSSALLLELNGKTIPPLGSPGRPGRITLTRNDLKKPPGGPD